METDSRLRSLLNQLGRAIERWNPNADATLGQNAQAAKISFAEKLRQLAKRIDVTDKSLGLWLNRPDSTISVRKLLEICQQLGIRPHTLFADAPQLEAFSENELLVPSEEVLLALERAMIPGARLAVAAPLFAPPLQLKPLITLHAQKGLDRDYSLDRDRRVRKSFDETDRIVRWIDTRQDRGELFPKSHWLLQQVLMRDELEYWANGTRIFKRIAPEQRLTQIDHLIALLKNAAWSGKPRLELRLTKSHLRTQFALYEQPDRSDLVVLTTSSGYLRIQHGETQAHLRHEFSTLWSNNVYEALRSGEEWVRFLEELKDEIHAKAGSNRMIAIKDILEAPA